MESSSFSRSSKRAKALGNIGQVANCLVDGCSADLSLCRDYHRRHKVCEAHSKTPKVTIAGREQRFCQQCSRFHSLVEFDEGKRSCRKRLDGHNRRRRKAQLGSLPQRLVSFSSTPNPMMGYSWSGAVKPPEMKCMESAANSFPKVAIQEASIGQPPFVYGSSSSSSSSSCCFSQVLDSNGAALSLLSSPTLNNTNTLMDYHLPHQTKPTFHFPDQTLSFMWD